MKKLLYLIGLCLLSSCVTTKLNYDCVLSNAINKTIQKDFFNDYREKGKLNVIVTYKNKLLKLKSCVSMRNVNLDSVASTCRYIQIEVSSFRVNNVRMQIGCHKETDKDLYTMYSTSYKVEEDCSLTQIYKPYIDLHTRSIMYSASIEKKCNCNPNIINLAPEIKDSNKK